MRFKRNLAGSSAKIAISITVRRRNSYEYENSQDTCRLVPGAHVPKIVFVVFVAPPTGFKKKQPQHKKLLGPIPQSPPEVTYLFIVFRNFEIFASYFNKLLPGELSLGLQRFLYVQEMELEKSCAICDSTSKGVSVACRQSWPFSIEC